MKISCDDDDPHDEGVLVLSHDVIRAPPAATKTARGSVDGLTIP
jgi:hypothetical protein